MEALLIVMKIVYVIVCVALIAIVLIQQGKAAGLSGVIGGAGESYWGKNKARSMESGLQKATIVFAVIFIALTLGLDIVSSILR